ncbi:MAG: hypothetical protein II670_13665 [Alphaproteobacteria bacterium]|nr:hypothetical protein [Alphaproteobacteria bacterium]
MHKILLAITAPTIVLATTQISETSATQSNGFEFLSGINAGGKIGWYDVGKKDLTMNLRIGAVDANAWNATSIRKTKLAPFLEGELSAQYLMNNVIIGISIAGGIAFGGKYRENGYKYFDASDNAFKHALNEKYEKEAFPIAKQRCHISLMPYIGYRTNPQTDIYLKCGLEMVETKYFDSETKRTYHPVIEIGSCYRFTATWFFRFEGCYVFPKKKTISKNIKVTIAPNTYECKAKGTVKHGEYVIKLGFGRRF